MIICFSTDNTIVNNLAPISINNCAVQRIEHAKLLCVTISSNLTWNAHVECIVSKSWETCFDVISIETCRSRTKRHLKYIGICNKTCTRICLSSMAHEST